MIELKENQKKVVLPHKGSYYACVLNVSENGACKLETFTEIPCIKRDEYGADIDFKKLNEKIDDIVKYNIGEKIQYVTNPDKYRNFVRELRSQAYQLYELQNIRDVIGTRLNAPKLLNQLNPILDSLTKKVDATEKVFQDQIVPQIPANWPYAMFPESSWTAYESDIELHNFAEGSTTLYADKKGTSLHDIKTSSYYRGELYTNYMDIYNGLNSQVEEMNKDIVTELTTANIEQDGATK